MACLITRGRLLGCHEGVGGVKTVKFVVHDLLPSITADADEMITDFGAAFTVYEYKLPVGTASFEETIQASQENGTRFYEGALEINLFLLSKEDRKEIQLMARNTLAVFVEDYNGNTRLAGRDGGMSISGGAVKTGKVMGDMSGYTLTFASAEKDQAQFVVPGTTDAFDNLTTATVTTVVGT